MPKEIKFRSFEEILHDAEQALQKEIQLARKVGFHRQIMDAFKFFTDESGTVQDIRYSGHSSTLAHHPVREALLERALRRFPTHAAFYAGELGKTYYDVDDLERALPHLETAASAQPIEGLEIPHLHNMLAIIYITKERYEKAAAVILKGKERTSYRNAGTDVLLGYAHLLYENQQAALEVSEESLSLSSQVSISPNEEPIAFNLAISLKARASILSPEQAVSAYHLWMDSFKDYLRPRIVDVQDYLYGTKEAFRLIELPLNLRNKDLKHLKFMSYSASP